MAGYGCARTYAELLGDRDSAQLVQTTLTEESDTDKELTKLAKSVINVAPPASASGSIGLMCAQKS
jgi:ferritin-like metal-binding protein YciE